MFEIIRSLLLFGPVDVLWQYIYKIEDKLIPENQQDIANFLLIVMLNNKHIKKHTKLYYRIIDLINKTDKD